MPQSTILDNGQTIVPQQVLEALHLQPNQKMIWDILPDGSVHVRPQNDTAELFGSLKTNVPFPGTHEEKEAVRKVMAEHAAKEGI